MTAEIINIKENDTNIIILAAEGPNKIVGKDFDDEPVYGSDMFVILKMNGCVYRSNISVPAFIFDENIGEVTKNYNQKASIEHMIKRVYLFGEINLRSWTLLYNENI